MTQYLTVENISLVILVYLALEKILRRIAPATAMTQDDALVASLDRARAWVAANAPLLWGIVEDLAGTGLFPKAQKAQEFGRRLLDEWQKAHPGKPLPDEAKAAAELVARGLSAADHFTPKPDPQPGPTPK